MVRRPTSYGRGSYDEIVHYPLAGATDVSDLDAYRWPKPDWFGMDSLADVIAAANADEPHCLLFSGGNIFETSWYMPWVRAGVRRHDDGAGAVPRYHAPCDRLLCCLLPTRVCLPRTARSTWSSRPTTWGGQNGLLMSLPMWREFIEPYHVELNRAIHEFGMRVIYHSDGAVMKVVPGLIEMGIDVLQALQFDAQGMDPAALKEQYGDRLGSREA